MRATLVGLLMLAAPGQAMAQSGGNACFRGRAPSVCSSHWITEATGGAQIGGNSSGYVAVDVGRLHAVGPRVSVGGTVAGGFASEDFFAALRPRLRYWATPTVGIDGMVGARWEPGRVEVFEVMGGVTFEDWGGAVGGVLFDVGQGDVSAMLAARAGSYPGLLAYAGGLIAAIAALIAFSNID